VHILMYNHKGHSEQVILERNKIAPGICRVLIDD